MVWVDRLGAMRGPSESCSDVILRIAGRVRERASVSVARLRIVEKG